MSMHDREQTQLDAVIADLRRASVYQVVGWTLLAFDALLIAMWIFSGLRAGSDFWLYWFVIEGVIGLALVIVGSYLKTKVGRHAPGSGRDKIRRVA